MTPSFRKMTFDQVKWESELQTKSPVLVKLLTVL